MRDEHEMREIDVQILFVASPRVHSCAPMACSEASAEQALRSGDYGAASQCLASLPQTAQTLYLQGGLLTISGDTSSALPLFRRAVAMQPSHADAHFEMGNALNSRAATSPRRAATSSGHGF